MEWTNLTERSGNFPSKSNRTRIQNVLNKRNRTKIQWLVNIFSAETNFIQIIRHIEI